MESTVDHRIAVGRKTKVAIGVVVVAEVRCSLVEGSKVATARHSRCKLRWSRSVKKRRFARKTTTHSKVNSKVNRGEERNQFERGTLKTTYDLLAGRNLSRMVFVVLIGFRFFRVRVILSHRYRFETTLENA